jgi:hypothetical protein
MPLKRQLTARYYISGRHAAYEVVDVEEIMRERNVEQTSKSLRAGKKPV